MDEYMTESSGIANKDRYYYDSSENQFVDNESMMTHMMIVKYLYGSSRPLQGEVSHVMKVTSN